MDLSQALADIQAVIEVGDFNEARRRIQAVCRADVPRELLYPLAQVCRIVYWPQKSVHLLGKIIRPGSRKPETATDTEKVEYAYAVGIMGSPNEAFELFRSTDGRSCPDAYYLEGLLRLRLDDFLGGEPYLRRYVAAKNIPVSNKLHAQVLIGSVLVHGYQDYEQAKKWLTANVTTVKTRDVDSAKAQHWAYVMLAQNEFLYGDADEGLKYVNDLKLNPKEDSSSFGVKLQKWETLLELKKYRDDEAKRKAISAKLMRLHDQAQSLGYDLMARYMRYYRCLCLGDETGLLRLYFGSRHEWFRKRILKTLKIAPETLPEQYHYRIGPLNPRDPVIDVTNGRSKLMKQLSLKEGQLPQKLFQIFGGEMYLYMNIIELHAQLFPKEYFNPRSSADRAHKVLKRLRQWFKENRLPLKISENDGFYRLSSDEGCTLIVPRPDGISQGPKLKIKNERILEKLRQHFGEEAFKADDGAKVLKVSKKTVTRLLNSAVAASAAARSGKGRAVRYQIKAS